MKQLPNKWHKRSTEQDFKDIFAKYYAPLCSYAQSILQDASNSEEVVQELFIKLWEQRHKLMITNIKAYLYTAVYKRSLHLIAHEKVKEKYANNSKAFTPEHPTPEEGMIMTEMYQAYQDELKQLSEKTQEIFLLSRNEDMSYKAIAEQLNISIKTVEAHISKALKAFKKRFEIIKQ